MKNFFHLFFLLFWFAAITTPAVITLMDGDNSIVVNTIGDEEQKEEEKKDPTEENIIQSQLNSFYLIALSNELNTGDFNAREYNSYNVEIILPPPKGTI